MAKNNAPNYSQLSANQTVTQSFEEANDAHRVVPMANGLPISDSNPLPVELSASPTIDIGDVTILVDGDEVTSTNPFPTRTLPFVWDYVSMALSVGNTRETYTFKTGGSGGTSTGTIVVNYTTSSRDVLVDAQITAI